MHKHSVAIILQNEKNQILLMQRGPQARSETGKWENPGGEVENHETSQAAAKREVLEELGIQVDTLTEQFVHSYPDAEQPIQWQATVYLAKTSETPQIQEPHKCSQLQWVAKHDLSSMDLTTYTRRDFQMLSWV